MTKQTSTHSALCLPYLVKVDARGLQVLEGPLQRLEHGAAPPANVEGVAPEEAGLVAVEAVCMC